MINIYLAEGFEEVEALTVVDVLRRAELDARTVSVTGSRIVTGTHGIGVEADLLFEETDAADCEMMIYPGGLPGATNLEEHEGLTAQLKAFAAEGKKIAAICAAPGALAAHGVLKDRRATVYPGLEGKLEAGGAQPTGEHATVDGNVITGQGPALAMEFALTIVREIKGEEAAQQVAGGLLYK